MLAAANALGLFAGYDLVVECSGNFRHPLPRERRLPSPGKPLVHGAIFKFEGQVAVFNYQHGPAYRCLYPAPPEPGDVPNCAEIGVLGALPCLVGTLQAAEALKIILRRGEVLAGRLLVVDARSLHFQTMHCRAVAANQQRTALAPDYRAFCGQPPRQAAQAHAPEISAEELKEWRLGNRPVVRGSTCASRTIGRRNIGGHLNH